MAQRQQAVKGVFTVQMVIPPMPMKGAFVGPERVDEIEALLPDLLEGNLHSGQRVQRRGR